MNDQEYIRKGVELADDVWPWDFWKTGVQDISEMSGLEIDALAAQLVRQVDASSPSSVAIYHGSTQVFADSGFTRRKGDDRTMNTIKAIVDSGVLG